MLEIGGLDVAYGESQVLWDVSLHVPAGGVMCLMGRNGVGKTTLLKSIMGLLPARSGRIIFDGADLGRLRPEERAARGIGYVPQGREIFPNLTVAENLRVGFLGRPKSAGNGRVAQADIEQAFDLFPKLKQLLSRKGGVLSGGEQQQLAIARVLLARPKLLLMDEPTEERGIGVLLVEQYLEFAWRLAGSYAIMRKGAIVASGSTSELRHDVVRQHLTV